MITAIAILSVVVLVQSLTIWSLFEALRAIEEPESLQIVPQGKIDAKPFVTYPGRLTPDAKTKRVSRPSSWGAVRDSLEQESLREVGE